MNGHAAGKEDPPDHTNADFGHAQSEASLTEPEEDDSFDSDQQSKEGAAAPNPLAVTKKRRVKSYGKRMSKMAQFDRIIFGIGPPQLGQPGSRIIHPYSLFGQAMTSTSSLLLVYVGVTTPVMIGFFWKQEDCTKMPTLTMDIIVDCFFMFEIVCNFFIGVSVQGVYHDNLLVVWHEYLRGSLLFDLCTSIPVSIIEYISLQDCIPGSKSSNNNTLKFIRVLKPLRIFKMLKVIKTSKLVGVIDVVESILRPPPLVTTMIKLFLLIFVMVHLCSCLFWLIKEAYSSEEQYVLWLSQQGLGEDPSLYEKYLVSAYFVSTVFTTVGFGDISAENSAERLLMIVIMFLGSIIFGMLIGEVQSSMAHINRFARDRLMLSQEVKSFLREKETPPILERKLMRYVLQDCSSRQAFEAQVKSISLLPEGLQLKIGQHLHQDLLNKIPVFMSIVDEGKGSFLVQLYMAMRVETHAKNLPVVRMTDKADRMLLIQRGTMRVDLNMTGPTVSNLNPGDSFGQYALYDNVIWQTEQGLPATFHAIDFVELLALHRDDFLMILRKAPQQIVLQIDEFAKSDRKMRDKLRGLGADNISVLRWVQLYGKILRRVRFERTKNAGFEIAGRRGSVMCAKHIYNFSLEEKQIPLPPQDNSAEVLQAIKLMMETQDRLQEKIELLQTSVQTMKEESAALEKKVTETIEHKIDELHASAHRRSGSTTPRANHRPLPVLKAMAAQRAEAGYGMLHDDTPTLLHANSDIVLKRPDAEVRVVKNHLVTAEDDWADYDDRGAARRRKAKKPPRAKLSPHSRQFLAELFPDVYPTKEGSSASAFEWEEGEKSRGSKHSEAQAHPRRHPASAAFA